VKVDDLPSHLWHRLRRELDDDESVMWVEQPTRVGLKSAGSVWLGLSLATALLAGVMVPLRNLYGWGWWVVAAPAGFAAALLLNFLYRIGPGRPVYAVTDRRAVLLHPGVGGDFYYWFPEDLGRRRSRAGSDGSGDIILGAEFENAVGSEGETQVRRRYDGAWYNLPNVPEAETYLAALEAQRPAGSG
jgi:hypothetical protein